jgi:hypothetical protein
MGLIALKVKELGGGQRRLFQLHTSGAELSTTIGTHLRIKIPPFFTCTPCLSLLPMQVAVGKAQKSTTSKPLRSRNTSQRSPLPSSQ